MPKGNPELAAEMGARMAKRRKDLGLTQEKVAEMAGIAHQQYNKAERGKTCLGSDTLQRITQALDIGADYLLSGKSEARYNDVMAVLSKMNDRQLRLATQALRCMVEFGQD